MNATTLASVTDIYLPIGECIITSISLASCLVVLILSSQITDSYRYLFGYIAFADALSCIAYLWTTARENVTALGEVPEFVCRLEYGFGQFAYFSKFISPSLPAITRYYLVCETSCQRYFGSGAQLRRLVICTNLFLLGVISLEQLPINGRSSPMPSCQAVKICIYPVLLLVGVCLLSFVASVYSMCRIYRRLNAHSEQLRLLRDSIAVDSAVNLNGSVRTAGRVKTQVAHKRVLATIAIQTSTATLLVLPLLTLVAVMLTTDLVGGRSPVPMRTLAAVYSFAFVPVLFSPLIDSVTTVTLMGGYRGCFLRLVQCVCAVGTPTNSSFSRNELAEIEAQV